MKVYIAGAITDNLNYREQFKEAEERLVAAGHAVINPCKNEGFTYREYINMGLCELMHCDAIYLLKGYETSTGALLEYTYAKAVELIIMTEAEATPKDCSSCCYYGRPSDAPETVEEECMYIPAEDEDYTPPCMAAVVTEPKMGDLISRGALLKKFEDKGIQITFDLPVEEVLGEDIDIDDFAMLVQDAIQAYKKMVIGIIKEMPQDSEV